MIYFCEFIGRSKKPPWHIPGRTMLIKIVENYDKEMNEFLEFCTKEIYICTATRIIEDDEDSFSSYTTYPFPSFNFHKYMRTLGTIPLGKGFNLQNMDKLR